MNKLVSVIIPTYNRKDLLDKAIKSVLKQKYDNVEIIVISDNSCDETDNYMKNYSDNKKIIYIKNDKQYGANYSRNCGIAVANGDYIAFLDDDDEWADDKLEKQIFFMEENPSIDLCFTEKKCIFHFEKTEYFYYTNSSLKNDYNDLLISNSIGTNSSVLLKKSALLEKYDTTLPALQDWDLWIRISKSKKIACLPEPLVLYHTFMNNSNIKNGHISSSVDKYLKAYSIINTKYCNDIKNLNWREKRKRRKCKYHDISDRYLRSRMNLKAMFTMFKSFIINYSLADLVLAVSCILSYKSIVKIKAFHTNERKIKDGDKCA